ncbi:hypothetical protein CRG98_020276 [Punica granatum]|uniref:Uncharacterized protein n=1 Tax=Punica granatum TaxID=22663 RepID=A0A2I0JST6_PUNGR|nr:hypothetical protein CRG98_020276 [Punica granatum]
MVKKIHEEARQHILKKNEQYVERANKGRKKVTFEPGDWVSIRGRILLKSEGMMRIVGMTMRLMHTSLEVRFVKSELMHKILEACMFRVGQSHGARSIQIQQAMESLLMGLLGQEEFNSIGSPNGFIQLTCHEIVDSPPRIGVNT